jgi:hypothetical protein
VRSALGSPAVAALALGALAVGALALGACATEEVLPAPSCSEGGSVLIVAQSVPTAQQIPCLGPLPEGWNVASVRVDQDGTTIRFDSDRAGRAAAVLRLADACDVSLAVPATSDQPPAARFDDIEQLVPRFRGVRYYVFPGGCVWWTFAFAEGASATETVAIGEALTLYSRATLNENVHKTFIDEDV